MGIPTPPGKNYGDDCSKCFPAGKTPARFWMSMGGIEFGEYAQPWWDAPPSWPIVLDQIAPCKYRTSAGWPICEYDLSLSGNSFARITLAIPGACFEGFSGRNCGRFMKNRWTTWEGNSYYGGHLVMCPVPASASYSFQSIADDIGVPLTEETMAEFWPVDEDEFMLRYALIQDSINILIKRELPPP